MIPPDVDDICQDRSKLKPLFWLGLGSLQMAVYGSWALKTLRGVLGGELITTVLYSTVPSFCRAACTQCRNSLEMSEMGFDPRSDLYWPTNAASSCRTIDLFNNTRTLLASSCIVQDQSVREAHHLPR